MNPRKYLVFALIAASLSLSSCSGVNHVCTANCVVGSNGSLNLVLAAEPFTPPPNTSILSFAVAVNSVSLTPSAGGSDVTIPLNTLTGLAPLAIATGNGFTDLVDIIIQ